MKKIIISILISLLFPLVSFAQLTIPQGGTGTTTLPTGSIPFGSTSLRLTSDRSNFFWDNTNKRLGIGTTTPDVSLTVNGNFHMGAGAYSPAPAEPNGSPLFEFNDSSHNGFLHMVNTDAIQPSTYLFLSPDTINPPGSFGGAGVLVAQNYDVSGAFIQFLANGNFADEAELDSNTAFHWQGLGGNTFINEAGGFVAIGTTTHPTNGSLGLLAVGTEMIPAGLDEFFVGSSTQTDFVVKRGGNVALHSLSGSGTKCVHADNTGTLSLAAADCGSGSGSSFPFTVNSWGNSTTSTLGFFNGFLSTASSTISSNLFLSSLSQGFLYTGTNGIVKSVASSSVNLSDFNNNLATLSATDASLTFTGSYNGSTARTVGLNVGNTNTWTVNQNFNYSSSTIYSSFVTASSTFLNAGSFTLATTSAGCASFNATGGLTSIGTACNTFSNTLANGGTATTTFSTGGVVFANSTQLTQNTPQFFWDNTNLKLGIGTTTPFAQLSVNSSAGLAGLTIGSSTATSFIVDKNGNVGVKTSAPSQALMVTGNGYFTNAVSVGVSSFSNISGWGGSSQVDHMYIQNTTSGKFPAIAIQAPASGGGAIQFVDNSGNPGADFGYVVGGEIGFANRASSQPINFYTAGAALQERILPTYSFFSNGLSVGAQSAPSSKLDVAGSVSIGSYANTNAGPSNGVIISGSVGIGTTTPGGLLSLQASTGDIVEIATSSGAMIGGYDSDGHRFTSGPTPAITLCGTGTGTVVGDDQSGTITTATAATACTATFSKAYQKAPVCTVTDDSLVGFADISSVSTSAVTFGISSALTGGHLYYQCSYHK